MSVTTDVPSPLKASDGRRMAPRKSACSAIVLAGGGVLLVEGEGLVTTARMPPGLRASSDLAMKKSCSDSFCPRYSILTSANGTLPITASTRRQLRVAEILDADVGVGVQRAGDAAGDANRARRR